MAKTRSVYICQSCNVESPKWIGHCPSCDSWNTYQEIVLHKETRQEQKRKSWGEDDTGNTKKTPKHLDEIELGNTSRISSYDKELDRVLGSGIVSGSLILVAGQPGIGKSTLMLQTALLQKGKALYISGEESEEQIKMRARRISKNPNQCYVLSETNLSRILSAAKELQPDLLVVDSIQTMTSPFLESTPGTISQIRECTAELLRFSKETKVPVFIIGHITKEGQIAGPKVLEHIVDVVLHFEGDRNNIFRIVRTVKNRFGSTDDMGIYEMTAEGLRAVENPSELLISQNEDSLSGMSIAASVEGQRPMLIETQALVSPAVYGNPQRSATGFDLRRLNMYLAVLEKRAGFPLGQQDVFLNIAGGIRVSDPGIDLAVISAIISSLEDMYIPGNMCFAGEVGLSGEIRAVQRVDQRIQEAQKLGFEKIILSKYNFKGKPPKEKLIEIVAMTKITDLVELILNQ